MYFGFLLQSSTCSFLGMESELTHIQWFLWLSDNVGMFYPLEQKCSKHWSPLNPPNLDAIQALICLISVNLHIPKNGMYFFHVLRTACPTSHGFRPSRKRLEDFVGLEFHEILEMVKKNKRNIVSIVLFAPMFPWLLAINTLNKSATNLLLQRTKCTCI